MSDQPVERGSNYDWKHEAEHYRNECYRLRDMLRKMECEIDEQARLNGMGYQREARLMARVVELEKELKLMSARDDYHEDGYHRLRKENARLREALYKFAHDSGDLCVGNGCAEFAQRVLAQSRQDETAGLEFSTILKCNPPDYHVYFNGRECQCPDTNKSDSAAQSIQTVQWIHHQAACTNGERSLRGKEPAEYRDCGPDCPACVKSRQETQSVEGSGQGCKSQGADVKGAAETGMEPDLPTSTSSPVSTTAQSTEPKGFDLRSLKDVFDRVDKLYPDKESSNEGKGK